jgi:hypothetical protein
MWFVERYDELTYCSSLLIYSASIHNYLLNHISIKISQLSGLFKEEWIVLKKNKQLLFGGYWVT